MENLLKFKMKNIRNHSNIVCFDFDFSRETDPIPVCLFEAHRYSALSMFYAARSGLIDTENPPSLVLFDFHDDGLQPLNKNKIPKNISNITERDFASFVDWDMALNDDDWIKTSIELGFIKDVVIFGAECGSLNTGLNIYTSSQSTTHKIWKLGPLWSELDYQGALSDRTQKSVYQDLWDVFGWDGGPYVSTDWYERSNSLIVDICLDAFSVKILDKNIPVSQDVLDEKWNDSRDLSRFSTSHSFFQIMLAKSVLINIAMESDYCGGVLNSHKILKMVNDIMFEGYLNL